VEQTADDVVDLAIQHGGKRAVDAGDDAVAVDRGQAVGHAGEQRLDAALLGQHVGVEVGVFDGRRQRAAQGLHQLQVVVAEAAELTVDGLQDADGALVHLQRDADHRVGAEAGATVNTGEEALVRVGVGDDDRLFVFGYPAGDALTALQTNGRQPLEHRAEQPLYKHDVACHRLDQADR
jgi:hypothetical protein